MARKIDLQTITIKKIIVHDVPHHKKSEVSITPSYGEKESGITEGLRLFFKDKVVQALGSDRAFKICYDESTSTVSWLVSDMRKSGCTINAAQDLLGSLSFPFSHCSMSPRVTAYTLFLRRAERVIFLSESSVDGEVM